MGATIRIYAESFERDPERHNRETQVQTASIVIPIPSDERNNQQICLTKHDQWLRKTVIKQPNHAVESFTLKPFYSLKYFYLSLTHKQCNHVFVVTIRNTRIGQKCNSLSFKNWPKLFRNNMYISAFYSVVF